MKLKDLLLEKSAVIKKDGFAVLQTALAQELPHKVMDTQGAQACLLHSFSEAIRQQTGYTLDRLTLLRDLDDYHEKQEMGTWYRPKKYHDLNELIKHITTTGVVMAGKSKVRHKFKITLHIPKSLHEVKELTLQGISGILAWENNDFITDASDLLESNNFRDYFEKSDLVSKEKFALKLKIYRNDDDNYDETGDYSVDHLYDIIRGIYPYEPKAKGVNSYHAVLLVGYEDAEDVFIFKDIRKKYLLDGMAKLPYRYVKDFLNSGSNFVKAVVGLEAEKL